MNKTKILTILSVSLYLMSMQGMAAHVSNTNNVQFSNGTNLQDNLNNPVNIPQGFERIKDDQNFNGTELIPDFVIENALIPKGFFSKLEKQINFTKISPTYNNKTQKIPELPKFNKSLDEKIQIGKNPLLPNINNTKNSSNGSRSGVNTGNIIFNGNETQLWKGSVNGEVIYSQTVQDLNGDGLNDLLITSYRYDIDKGIYYYTVQTKSGKDGKDLWQESINGSSVWMYAYPVGDINGDGIIEMEVNSYAYDPLLNRYTETIEIKKGNDGTTLWKDTVINGYINGYPITNDDGSTILFVSESYSNAGTIKAINGKDFRTLWQKSISNGYIYGNPVGDLNGDGINDFLVNFDYNSGSQTSLALEGSNGNNLWQVSINNGYIYGYSAGDLNGDKLNDVLLNIHDSSGNTNTLIAKRGYDGYNLWQESVNNGYITGYSIGDLNGDNLNDVLVTIHDLTNNTDTLIAKRGYDGYHLWQESVNNGYIYAYSVGDLNGDKLNDFLVYIRYYSTNTQILIALDGSNGNHLWQETVINGYISGYSGGDFNGDKLNDILVDIVVIGDYPPTHSETLIAERGYDGYHLWQESITNGSIYGYIPGDLNGDGLNDLLINLNSYSGTQTLIAERGYDGYHLWQESITNGTIYTNFVGDLGGGTIVLKQINNFNTNTTTLESVRSYNGNILWSYSWPDYITKNGNQYHISVWAYPIGDVNNDGIGDILIQVNYYYYGQYYYDSFTSMNELVEGSNGKILWQRISPDQYTTMYADPIIDINGDGFSDILLNSRNSNSATLEAMRGFDGSTLWKQSVQYGDIEVYYIGDIDKDNGNDIIIKVNSNYIGQYHGIIAKNGFDGTDIWKAESYGIDMWLGDNFDFNGDGYIETFLGTNYDMYMITPKTPPAVGPIGGQLPGPSS